MSRALFRPRGFTLIELLISVAIIGILAAIAIPNLIESQRRSRYTRAATDTRVATTQAIIYAQDIGKYPPSIAAMRNGGYANVGDFDSWNVAYVLAPLLVAESMPSLSDDAYVYSKGASGAGVYPVPFVINTGLGGSVGYSSVYGSWTGR